MSTSSSVQKSVSGSKAPSRLAKVIAIDSGGHRAKVLARRDALVAEHLNLVPPIAARILANLPPSFELDDLIQTGRIGLMSAALRYSPKTNNWTPFVAYANRVIEGTIRMSTRRRHYQEATRVSLDSAMEYSDAGSSARVGTECCTQHGPNETAFFDELEPRADSAIEIVIDRKRLVKRISRQQFTDLQAAVLTAYYSAAEPSLATVAAQLGIPEWRAQRARAEALVVLRKILKAA